MIELGVWIWINSSIVIRYDDAIIGTGRHLIEFEDSLWVKFLLTQLMFLNTWVMYLNTRISKFCSIPLGQCGGSNQCQWRCQCFTYVRCSLNFICHQLCGWYVASYGALGKMPFIQLPQLLPFPFWHFHEVETGIPSALFLAADGKIFVVTAAHKLPSWWCQTVYLSIRVDTCARAFVKCHQLLVSVL